MKVFSLCCVRDENDMIEETLEAALAWNTRIFVFDNGSVDGTWETIERLARRHAKIEIVGRDDRVFTDALRGEIFEAYRSVASPGDWWCRLDSDEIYVDAPDRFLAAVPHRFGFVLPAFFNFYFTDEDLANYRQDPAGWLAKPVRERLKFYQNNWSEPRFVRHRNDLVWGGINWPDNRGRTCPSRIRLRHFPYRSPEQISKRLAIRQKQPTLFKHEANRSLTVPNNARPDWSEQYFNAATFEEASWEDRVRKAAECDRDAGDDTLVTRNDLMPRLPAPIVDFVRAGVLGTRLGRAILSPVLERRRGLPKTRGGDLWAKTRDNPSLVKSA